MTATPAREKPLPKSARTQAAILDAARHLFSEKGYENTTIREVAQAAAIDASMVMRYFGSKDGLFAAATRFDLCLPNLADTGTANAGSTLVRHFLKIWEGPDAVPGMTVLLRSAASSDIAAARMTEVFASQVIPAIRAIMPGTEPPVRAGLVSSQLLGLAFARYILRLEPLASMDSESVVRWVAPAVQHYLSGETPS